MFDPIHAGPPIILVPRIPPKNPEDKPPPHDIPAPPMFFAMLLALGLIFGFGKFARKGA